MHDLRHISMAVSRIGKEMEHGAVVPDVEPAHEEVHTRHIAFHPMHGMRILTALQRSLRHSVRETLLPQYMIIEFRHTALVSLALNAYHHDLLRKLKLDIKLYKYLIKE